MAPSYVRRSQPADSGILRRIYMCWKKSIGHCLCTWPDRFKTKVDDAPTKAQDKGMHVVGSLEKESFYQLLDNSLIYVGPSLYEPFGLAPLEAAHSGCALLLSDIPSFREVWDDCATYFSPGDPQDLSRAMSELTSDETYCKLMGELRAKLCEIFVLPRSFR